MLQEDQSRKRYPSELPDEPWTLVEPLLPPAQPRQRGGRPRQVALREVLNTLRSLHRRGCQGAMRPHALLPTRTAYDDFAQGRDDGPWGQVGTAGRAQTRVAAGRAPTPRARWIARQSVKPPARGDPERGADGGKRVQGRQRHLWVDPLGLRRAVWLTGAGRDDGSAAPQGRALLSVTAVPRLETIFGDTKDHKHELHAWMAIHRPPGRLAVKPRPAGRPGCTPGRQRWVVERPNAWHGRDRRHSQDEERKPTSRAVRRPIRSLNLRLNRLSPRSCPAFRYHQQAA
jgi:transposase